MKSIGAALNSALRSIDQANLANFARIEREWENIIGARMAAVSKPARLSHRTLVIWAAEPVWADSMMYLKSQIRDKVNTVLGKEVIDSIRVTVKSDLDGGAAEGGAAGAADGPPPSPETLAQVEALISQVPDSALRSILKRVMLENIKVESKRSRPR